ncbi:hypothetical protein LK996_02190 [Lysobacter sp. A6]|uniref:Uncharacterized protein n=1 Tax=Noviluteimonas lactosilytica TaxID=2888523 RepID=A0ABS8JE66_9GAMM|nr:hypothetical protein [Lysobacter lactosilyticus]MCC8361894.1 hypothetical protein [Lysobacter lactosilyticus]
MNLDDQVGKTISDFCGNHFNDAAQNHCAHFVSHVLGVDAGYDCKLHMGGGSPGASLRVHELFAACPTVGKFDAAPNARCLVFVTRKEYVDVGRHSMRNHPQKHVGILDNGAVYHYSNTGDVVIKQSPQEFLERFDRVYAGQQALFYGTLPGDAQAPTAVTPAAADTRPVLATRAQQVGGKTQWLATIDRGAEYLVGTAAKYGTRKGLSKSTGTKRYAPADHADRIGAEVADLLGIIALGESNLTFDCINSYDRAAFTFGFFQLAAHTPNDNLILLFRKLVADHAGFRKQFPELAVKDGRLWRTLPGGALFNLERPVPRFDGADEHNLKDFMAWLNPDPAKVDDVELDRAARMVWLANNDDAFNAIQVDVARHITMSKLREYYDRKLELDGVNGLVCAAICDILHQGRGTFRAMKPIVHGNASVADKCKALSRIGEADYPQRCKTLRLALQRAKDGALAKSVFERASGVFRPAAGWDA